LVGRIRLLLLVVVVVVIVVVVVVVSLLWRDTRTSCAAFSLILNCPRANSNVSYFLAL